eukprot:CAMPEP_0201281338 /NCGR_PEP_ID=MMETSP1317-20130820/2457_1 /ASSEMBLY_ACC=CAM_ASM_000770 /TAXON_ID=187299 /ORGANISM="Undescribed Undescribed, Strain Undescribed" /LENGTH=194 /DNA_ID=CAMNT_0047590945 /DNA_START=2273 /DNA_END=2857 /DNA_ORIENTATION=-
MIRQLGTFFFDRKAISGVSAMRKQPVTCGENLYVGQVNSNGKPHGSGTYVWKETGNKHEGYNKDGKSHGRGRQVYASTGNAYIGEWLDDERYGVGKYFWESGSKFQGELRDKIEGYGEMITATHAMYIGVWIKDNNEGFTINMTTDGRRYEGNFKNDKWDGVGRLYKTDKTVILGTWSENELQTTYHTYTITDY